MKTINIRKLYQLGCCGLFSFSALCSHATSVDVTFTANIRETTCDMTIEGGTGDGTSNTIPIGSNGKLGLNKITSGDSAAQTDFKLKITECPSSLQSLKTTVQGTPSAIVKTAIVNGLSSSDAASYIGVTIARSNAPDNAFVINSTTDTERLVWTSSEISSKQVQLIAKLVETTAGKGTTGPFSALATFNFTYQ